MDRRRTVVSRRTFLGSAALAGLGMVLKDILRPSPLAAQGAITHWDGSPLGRVLQNKMTVYSEPAWGSRPTGDYFYWNDIVAVLEAVVGDGLYSTNDTWLRVEQGYIYSSWVQPCADQPNNPSVPIGEGGAWGIVTVPITWTRTAPADDASTRQRMYYNTVHRLMALENDYYLVEETYGYRYWIKAAHVRVIPPEELAPISAHVPPEQKRVEVSIYEQRLYAYEGEQVVFSSHVSTGQPRTPTPLGEFRVYLKRPGQRMIGGQGEDFYNLAGIPWISYFTQGGAALHGTYWHNDYGRQHSAGCVNLPPEAAKWLFRWTTPAVNYWDFSTRPDAEAGQPGTRVIVRV